MEILGKIMILCLTLTVKAIPIEKVGLVCSTEICKETAKEFLNMYINKSADPCQDFHNFVCGNFIAKTEIPADEEIVTTLTIVSNRITEDLKKVLEEPMQPDAPLYERKLRTQYNACMNKVTIEKKGVSPMLKLLEKFGGWPVIYKGWNENAIELTDFFVKLMLQNSLEILDFSFEANNTNSSEYSLIVHQGIITYTKDFYFDQALDKDSNALTKFMTDTALLFKMTRKDDIEKDVKDVIIFKNKLLKIFIPPQEINLQIPDNLTLAELEKIFNNTIKFDVLLKAMLDKFNAKIKKDKILGVSSLRYINDLATLLEKTPKRTIINYFLMKMVKKLIIAMPQKFQDIQLEYDKVTLGISKAKDRYKTCISLLRRSSHRDTGALFVKRYFNDSVKHKVSKLIAEIKESFSTIISQISWLTSKTKLSALDKLIHMKENVGYPDDLFDKTLVTTHIQEETFLENCVNQEKLNAVENLILFRKPANFVDKVRVIDVNAGYTPSNIIIFPAGILQPSLYSEFYPMYLNFGGIGVIIGHEIVHGFDSENRHLDKDGRRVNWWDNEDDKKFEKASQCLIDQYDKFVVQEINEHVNGKLTLAENISDNGGIRTSFLAYQQWMKRYEKIEQQLPGLPYTFQQLFFINFARTFCETMTPKMALRQIMGHHSPGRFRIIGSLRNMEQFSEAFNCPPGSGMNPINKCRVW